MPKFDTSIVGCHHYRGADERLRSLRPGTPLRLRAEPLNPYDKNAIEVLHSGTKLQKLGYVPRRDAGPIARLMREGHIVTAVLTGPSTRQMVLSWTEPKPQRAIERDFDEDLWGERGQ